MCACAEIDSHADTTPAGAHFVLLEVTKKVCDVRSFHDSMELIKGVSVGTCDKVYSHLDLIQETIAFYKPYSLAKDMESALIHPNQLCDFGIQFNSTPRKYDPSLSHAFVAHEEDIAVPLKLHCCISYFPTRLPTPTELKET